MIAGWVSNRSWDFRVLFTTSKTHDLARYMTSPKHLLFRATNWNYRPTLYSTPMSQIVSYRIFYCLEFFSSGNLLLPEINRKMQTLYSPSTPYTLFLDRTIFRVPKQCASIVVWYQLLSIIRDNVWLLSYLPWTFGQRYFSLYLP